ncbi:LysM peptidoglycan-binding domain-containing M23 family metallopeptidase [bacterium]|nr:LysM peptidoglycan-binding domain-containing M23 family metallopeptidase [bacterium]
MMKRFFKTTLILALALFAASASAENILKHTLEKGETLYSVSRKYKVSYEALASANGITDPTKLKVGTVLIIPSVHVVEKGETLFGLARQYGISVGDLLAANKLNQGYVLKIGDVLVVPAAGPAADSAVQPVSAPAVPASTTTSVAKSAPGPAATTATTASTTTSLPPAKPAAATTTTLAAGAKTPPATTTTVAKPASATSIPMPEPVKLQEREVDPKLGWPVPGKALYLDGKLEGVMIRVKPGEITKAIASGTVVSAGPSRGFSQVAFVQAKSGYVYVYGGNESLSVKTGDQIASGKEIGKIGLDPKDGSPIA